MQNRLFKYLTEDDKAFLVMAFIFVPLFGILGLMIMKGIYEVYGPYALVPFYGFVALHKMLKA